MKDYLGKELEIGDIVVTVVKGYRDFTKAQVVGFTPKKVRVIYKNWNKYVETFLTVPELVIKIDQNLKGD